MKGITLIALVITIIVLLILAGVSMTTLIGENGILTQANESKEIVELSTLKEEWQIYKLDHLNEIINVTDDSINNVLTTLKNTKYKDYITIENDKIKIDMNGIELKESEKEYIYNNLDVFYLVEYGKTTEWEIEIVSEEERTCKITKINQSNVKKDILKIPDYIVKDDKKYKVTRNEHEVIEDIIEVEKVFIPETIEILKYLGKTNGLKEIYMSDGCINIEYGCFSGYNTLENIRLPNTLEIISGASFWGCRNLKTITIPSSVTEIGGQAFGGTGLIELIMPDSVVKLGTQIFQDCHYLELVKFSNNTTIIPQGTFLNSTCKKIIFSNNLLEIQDKSLKCGQEAIEIPNGVKKLGSNLFDSHTTKIRIPNSVDEVGDFINVNMELMVYTDNPKVIEYLNKTKAIIKSYSEWDEL